jgi:uncharacterized membrane protein YdjX (TVP38/TMEM64 family)/NADPH-dependent 2,4-dienoyl-CoA reductase/sulfur reductase-like enzyme
VCSFHKIRFLRFCVQTGNQAVLPVKTTVTRIENSRIHDINRTACASVAIYGNDNNRHIKNNRDTTMKAGKIIVLLGFIAAIAAFFLLGGQKYLSFEYVKAQQAAFQQYYQANQAKTIAIYFVAYVVITALSLPAAAVITLVGGAIFGVVVGSIVVSFASTLGATIAFLASRFVLRDSIESKFGSWLKGINEGLERDGPFYLFTIRMIPAIPFFVVNLVFGLTKIKTWTFYWVSQVGMLLGTIVFVNAGTQLAKLESAKGIFSPSIIGAFTFLAILPFITRKIIDIFKSRKVYAKWNHLKPKSFDYNMVVIGAGSAGLVTSLIAGAVKAKVMLVERHKRGGDCLNTGCVPSKALVRSAKMMSHIRRADEFGVAGATGKVDFRAVMERIQGIIKTIEPHDSAERFATLGVDNMAGEARITSPWHVEVTKEDGSKTILTTKTIVIAAGARPFVPPIPGLQEAGVLTSDTLWELREQPKRLVVLGGGPIGSEMTQAFARLGTHVTQVEMAPRIMVREDEEVSQFVQERFKAEGVDVRVNHKAKQVVVENGEKALICEFESKDVRIPFDAILCAVGRVANTTGYGLEELGIGTSKTRTVEANEFLQTVYPQHLGSGRRGGAVSIHPHGSASSLVRGGEWPVWHLQARQGRLFRGALGYLCGA